MAIYDLSYLGTSTNQIRFNDYDNPSPAVYRAVSRAPQRRQLRELDIPVPFESGIADFETLIGQTSYVIEGIMYPVGEAEYDTGLAALRKLASLEIEQADVLSDSGYVPYVFTENARLKQVFLKVLYVDIREDTRKGLVQPFKLICKIKDPTIFGATLNVASTQTVNFSAATGTAIFPKKFPLIFGASTSTVSVDAINLGDSKTYPVSIQIHGPVNSPKITNTSTGEYIEVSVNLASTGNTLAISYDKDSLRVELDGVSVINQVTAASTFWKLQPGSNVISLSGSSVSTNAYATVSFYSAWPLS